jgi:hypothetical protein
MVGANYYFWMFLSVSPNPHSDPGIFRTSAFITGVRLFTVSTHGKMKIPLQNRLYAVLIRI